MNKLVRQKFEQNILFVCKDHVDMGLDAFVEEKEEPPELDRVDRLKGATQKIPVKCFFCEATPEYAIGPFNAFSQEDAKEG